MSTYDEDVPDDVADLDDGDEAAREVAWLASQRATIVQHLARERVAHGGVATTPAWAAAPMLALWPVQGAAARGTIGWWAVAGDVPTDYIVARGVPDARSAVAAFAARWRDVAEHMARGEPHPGLTVGAPAEWPRLSELLRRRADTLARWAGDDAVWA